MKRNLRKHINVNLLIKNKRNILDVSSSLIWSFRQCKCNQCRITWDILWTKKTAEYVNFTDSHFILICLFNGISGHFILKFNFIGSFEVIKIWYILVCFHNWIHTRKYSTFVHILACVDILETMICVSYVLSKLYFGKLFNF